MTQRSRRKFIQIAGSSAALTTFAGCLGGDGSSGDGSGESGGTASGNDADSGGDGGGDSGGATTSGSTSQLEQWAEKAKNEEDGTVNIAHFLAGETADALFSTFQEDIPWLKPNGLKFSGSELISRYQAEYQSGNPSIDMVWAPSVSTLANQGMLANLEEKLPAWDQVPEGAKGETWVPNKTSAYGMHYNSDLISESELPSDWASLTDSQYRDRIIIGQSFSWVFPGMKWAADNNDGWLEAMAEQNVQWASGLGAAVKQMAAGQKALNPFTNLKYPWIEGRAAGTPAKVATKTTPIFLYVNPSSVNKKAPNMNSALYLANYLCTEEGQSSIKQFVETDCAGLSKETLKCDPPEMNQTLHEQVDEFQFTGFLGPEEYNSFAERVQNVFNL